MTLTRRGIHVKESAAAAEGVTGAPARRRDFLRQALDPDAEALKARRSMSEYATEQIMPGKGQNIIDDQWLTDLSGRVDAEFDAVRNMTRTAEAADPWVDSSSMQMLDWADNVRDPDAAEAIRPWVDGWIDDIQQGVMTPQRWTEQRSAVAEAARSKGESYTSRGALYEARGWLDKIMSGGDPEVVSALGDANSLWQVAEVLESPGVLHQATGTINTPSFLRNMRRMFPGIWKTDGSAPPRWAELYDTFRASSRFPEFRSSGTSEALAQQAPPWTRARMAGELAIGTQGERLGGSAGRTGAITAGDAASGENGASDEQ